MFLLEADETVLYNQLYKNIPENVYKEIVWLDPTSIKDNTGFVTRVGKYSKWVLDLWRRDKFHLNGSEQARDVFNAFQLYDKHKNKLTGEYAKYKNIANIKTVKDLMEISYEINKLLTDKQIASRSEINQAEKDVEIIFDDDLWQVVIPKTYQASIKWGHKCANASWCTASSSAMNHYNRYAAIDNLYIFYNKQKPESSYQLFIHDPEDNNIEFNNVKNQHRNFKEFLEDDDKLAELYKNTIKPESLKIHNDTEYYKQKMVERVKETNSIYILLQGLEEYHDDFEYFKTIVNVFKGDLNQDILISETEYEKKYTRILDVAFIRNYKSFHYLWNEKKLREFYDEKRIMKECIYDDVYNKLDIFKYLAQKNKDYFDKVSSELLSVAADNNKFHFVKYLVEEGADINYNQNECIAYAMKVRNLDMTIYLIEHTKELNDPRLSLLKIASERGYIGVVELLIEKGEDPKELEPYDLHSMLYKKEFKTLEILIKHGADINANDSQLLIITVDSRYRVLDQLKFLVEHGINIHAREDHAFEIIAHKGNLEEFKYCVEELHFSPFDYKRIINGRVYNSVINGAILNNDHSIYDYITAMPEYEQYMMDVRELNQ